MGRGILNGMLSLSLCLSLLPVEAAAHNTEYMSYLNSVESEGGITYEAVEISSEDDLKKLAEAVNGGDDKSGVYYRLITDIALSGEWTPVGTAAHPFNGVFDGDGNKIDELYISSGNDYQGLFGYVGKGGIIKNLTVTGGGDENEADVTGGSYVGAIAGYSSGTIEGCTVEINVDGGSSGQYVGGVVGYNTGTVSSCLNDDTRPVSGHADIGGIAGYNGGSDALVDGCTNRGHVGSYTSGLNVGGIVGLNDGGTVTNCHNYGHAENGNAYVGGIVGLNRGNGTVSRCNNTGVVSCSASNQFNNNLFLGGIVGSNGDFNDNVSYMTDDNPRVRYCSNSGSVGSSIDGGNCVGGIVGANCFGMVEYCYNLGDIGANATVAGVVGINSRGMVRVCFNSGSIDGVGNRIGGVVGYCRWGSTAENLYNMGTVTRNNPSTSTSGSACGGIVGENNNNTGSSSTTMRNCYNIGVVSGLGHSGSVVGYIGSRSSVQNCFFLDDADKGIRSHSDGIGIGYGSGEAAAKTIDEFHEQSPEHGAPLAGLLNGVDDVWEYSELLGRPIFKEEFLREFTLPAVNSDAEPLTYTGEAQSLGSAIVPGTTVVGRMTYGADKGSIYEPLSALAGTDAGAYDVWYTVTLGANYNSLVTPEKMTVEIVKAPVIDLSDNVTIYRDRAGKTETVDLTEPEGFPKHLDIITDSAAFTVVPDRYCGLADAEADDGILTLVTNDSSDPESDTVVIMANGMKNYEDFTITVKVNWELPYNDSGSAVPDTGIAPDDPQDDVPQTGVNGYSEAQLILILFSAGAVILILKPLKGRAERYCRRQ